MWQKYFIDLTLILLGIQGVLTFSSRSRKFSSSTDSLEKICVGKGQRWVAFHGERELDHGKGCSILRDYNVAGIYTPDAWIHAGKRSTVELFCRVCGVADNCQYTVRWSKNGEPLSRRKSSRIRPYIVSKPKHLYGLRISNFRKKDYGMYSCTYYTSTGDELETQVEVSGVPLLAIFEEPKFNSPHSATLTWRVNCSTPIINYQLEFRDLSRGEREGEEWIVINIPARNRKSFEKTQSYTFNGLKHETTYQARIKSRNVYGSSDYSNVLKFRTLRDVSNQNSSSIQNDERGEESTFDLQSNEIFSENDRVYADGAPLKTQQSRGGYAAFSKSSSTPKLLSCLTFLGPLFTASLR